MNPSATIRLGPDAARLRRALGPMAWIALEVVAAQPRSGTDPGVVAMSVRMLAGELGVATNTAQRALCALRDAGLVEHAQRRADSGRFDTAIYRLAIPSNVLVVDHAASAPHASKHSAQHPRSVASEPAPSIGQQLVLLPS